MRDRFPSEEGVRLRECQACADDPHPACVPMLGWPARALRAQYVPIYTNFMAERPTFRDLDRFTKAKGLPRISKVAGGLRGVYLDPSQVQVFDGKDINGSRGVTERESTSGPAPQPSTESEAAPAPHDRAS